jgi:hypothetical protein
MDKMKDMWDTRYAAEGYAYGSEPNEFFKDSLKKYKLTGSILFPAEGEGRNAVYAAQKGLDVSAFDISIEGKNKAMKLAEKAGVQIFYELGNFFELELIHKKFDAAVLIYAHFPPPLLSKFYTKISELILPNGMVILEGFSKNNLKFREDNPGIGGPDNSDMLFSVDTIQNLFPEFEIIELEEVEVNLKEGKFHNGRGSVIRFIGKKKA